MKTKDPLNDHNNVITTKKLKACIRVLDELIEYKEALPDAFEHMDGDIDVCYYCKIPFIYNQVDEPDDYAYCHDSGLRPCEKKWCKRLDFCANNMQKCAQCDQYICADHSYFINNKNYCRKCQKNQK